MLIRDRQPSLADAIIEAHVLLDGRFRLDVLVRRSATTTVHVATHRNGSTAWLKLPLSRAHADLITLEAAVANKIGSALLVRDDGKTPDGLPYLVLDPPDAESAAAMRVGARDDTTGGARRRVPLSRMMTIGDALARVVGSIHAIGLTTTAIEDEDVLVFTNGDVALLHLHSLVPATANGIAADVGHVQQLLATLLAEVTEAAQDTPAAVRLAIQNALGGSYADLAAFQAAWRAASPTSITPPARRSSNSIADIPSAPELAGRPPHAPHAPHAPSAPHDTPHALSIGNDPEPSIIGFLKSSDGLEPPSSARPSFDRGVMSDPLSNHAEMPRLVQATSLAPRARPAQRGRSLVGIAVAVPVVALIAGTAWLAWSSAAPSASQAQRSTSAGAGAGAAAALEAAEPTPTAPTPIAREASPAVKVSPAEPASPAAAAILLSTKDDDLELHALLRTEGAPPDRDVFIDGKSVGKTPLRVNVTCGSHTLQMVAGAPKQRIELPCGGERVVRYDASGRWNVK